MEREYSIERSTVKKEIKHSVIKSFWWLIVLGASATVVMLGLIVLILVKQWFFVWAIIPLAVIVALSVCFATVIKKPINRTLYASFGNSKQRDYKIEILEDGMTVYYKDGANEFTKTCKYEEIYKTVRSKQNFIIFFSKFSYLVIPASVLYDEEVAFINSKKKKI